MLEQLLNGNDYNVNTIMLFGVIAILVLMISIAIGFSLSALITDKDIFLGIMALIVAIIGAAGLYVPTHQLKKQINEIKTIKKGHVEDYYRLTKDGKAIKFTLKDDKSEYLQKQAEAKIIDEDSKTYQIQYEDTIDRVPKSAVK
mgnify:CR=1 FL=1|jgi:Skp family chaperone for outer membrane proteins